MDHSRTRRGSERFAGVFLVILFAILATPAHAQRSVPVTVEGTDLDPIRVRQAIEPINIDGNLTFSTSLISAAEVVLYTVPNDRRLVIESVSAWSFTTSCSFYLTPIVSTEVGGNFATFRLNTPDRTYHSGLGAYYLHNLTQNLRLYADPGTSVRVDAIRSASGCNAIIRYSISGHLVPID